MDDNKKMLRAIINGISGFKEEVLRKFNSLNQKVDKGFKDLDLRFDKFDKRIDKLGLQIARLEDDTPTISEFDDLEERVSKLEVNQAKN